MLFRAEVIKDMSFDPFFKLEFFFEADGVSIKRGFADITRETPRPVIVYDSRTEQALAKVDRTKLELELLNSVIQYIFKTGVRKSWKGNIILRTA